MDSGDSDILEYISDSSADEIPVTQSFCKGRKNIRKVKHGEEISEETRQANIKEAERLKRLENLKEQFELRKFTVDIGNKLILDFDFDNNVPLVSVHESLSKILKDHQKEGVKFMWNACYESLEQIKRNEGSGCILAHCMGLGKTVQVITLIHTILCNKDVKTNTVLICCPKNTLLNWINEFKMWISFEMTNIAIYNPTKYEDNSERCNELTMWHLTGGVCIINYELLRILLENTGKKGSKGFSFKQKEKFKESLLDPGPDLIVCDEGHILKNEETKLFKIISQIRTLRRIILTGTPMQNNLREYHCMLQFVKPNLLGTRNEFLNMFVNPILNGQYENSLVYDVRLMKERSHILHKKLVGCVQRFDLSVLKQYLPEKHEYVISVALSDSQIDMYRFYMANYSAKGDPNWKNQATQLFADYQALQRIWTHPYVLKQYEDKYAEMIRQGKKKKKGIQKNKKRKNEIDDDDGNDGDDTLGEVEYYHWSRYPLSWWTQFSSLDSIEDVQQGNKLVLFLKILNECEEVGDKLLLFTGSLFSLRMIEHFLKRISSWERTNPSLCNMTSTWEEEEDYVILTGQTSSKDRDTLCQRFNNQNDTRLRLFLISTKAGGMGINLTAANRAILFDVSWNPSHDIQSTFRIYRLGQTKPCYIYRFVACGTMEQKIYERQVAKQSISRRVVDELQTARHFTQTELLELYKFEPYKKNKINTAEVKDSMLRKIMIESLDIICGVHEHDTLLQHKEDEELEEMEKNNAWSAYNKETDYEYGFNILPKDVKEMLDNLKPEDFDLEYLKMVLENKHSGASSEQITEWVESLKPDIERILQRPDFIELMRNQAFIANSYEEEGKVTKEMLKITQSDDSITILDDLKENDKPNNTNNFMTSSNTTTSNDCLSDSEDSVFLFECRGKKRKRKIKKMPLNSWGAKHGKRYGTPDTK